MIGLDTSILIRYITDDDPYWSPKVQKFIDEKCSIDTPGFIHPLVLAEIVWSLKSHKSYTRDRIAKLIQEFLDADNLIVGNAQIVELALEAFINSNIGFADCLISALNTEAGANPTYSIDKDAIKSGIFAALS
jgi:predicted nucleic-acid-binding protein